MARIRFSCGYQAAFSVARILCFLICHLAGKPRTVLIGKTGITLAKVFPSLHDIVYTLRINVQQELGTQSVLFVPIASFGLRNVDNLQQTGLLTQSIGKDK